MTQKDGEFFISRCLGLIETQLGWGPSEQWTNYDFSKLSDEVHQRTQVRLSVTTLKRVWGRLKYDSAPAHTTLNVLAQFAGYTDWREFCRQHGESGDAAAMPDEQPREIKQIRYKKPLWVAAALTVIMPAAWFFLSSTQKPAIDPEKFEFRANKMVATGVPNSVVFTYDATAATTDSIYIVQTWDISRKTKVSRNDHAHSAIYYYPGFFRTKLIVDTTIVRTHDLMVASDGWLALIESSPLPLYFKKDEYMFPDRVEVDETLLSKYNLSLHPQPPMLRLFNQRELGDIMSDNFEFETTLKTDLTSGTAACQHVQVLIQCKDDIIFIPLGAKACVGDMFIAFCGYYRESKSADLSGFGTDLTEWTHLRVAVANKHAKIFVNGLQVYELDFPHDPTGVVGLQYRFSGVGAVKDTWFKYGTTKIPM